MQAHILKGNIQLPVAAQLQDWKMEIFLRLCQSDNKGRENSCATLKQVKETWLQITNVEMKAEY